MCMAWACLNRPTRECIAVARYKGAAPASGGGGGGGDGGGVFGRPGYIYIYFNTMVYIWD